VVTRWWAALPNLDVVGAGFRGGIGLNKESFGLWMNSEVLFGLAW
jgi:hypothetical protein